MAGTELQGHLDGMLLAVLEAGPAPRLRDRRGARAGAATASSTSPRAPSTRRCTGSRPPGLLSSRWEVVSGRRRRVYALSQQRRRRRAASASRAGARSAAPSTPCSRRRRLGGAAVNPIAAYLDELSALLRRGSRRRILAEVDAHLLRGRRGRARAAASDPSTPRRARGRALRRARARSRASSTRCAAGPRAIARRALAVAARERGDRRASAPRPSGRSSRARPRPRRARGHHAQRGTATAIATDEPPARGPSRGRRAPTEGAGERRRTSRAPDAGAPSTRARAAASPAARAPVRGATVPRRRGVPAPAADAPAGQPRPPARSCARRPRRRGTPPRTRRAAAGRRRRRGARRRPQPAGAGARARRSGARASQRFRAWRFAPVVEVARDDRDRARARRERPGRGRQAVRDPVGVDGADAAIPSQRVLVNRLAYDFGSPQRGDIVVFHPPELADLRGRPSPSNEPCPQSVVEAVERSTSSSA